jgi:ferredoxin
MQDFLERLPPAAVPKPTLIFVTQGVWSGDGAFCMRPLVANKGYRLRWAVHFTMPGNICLDLGPLLNRFFRSMRAKPEDALDRISRLARKVAREEPWIMGRPAFLSGGWMQRIPFRMTMSYWQSGHLRVDPDLCSRCGRCIRLCPVDNIQLQEGLPVYGDGCMLCLRCFNYCPQKAVVAFGRPFNPKWYGEAPYRGPTPDFRPEEIIGEDSHANAPSGQDEFLSTDIGH